MVSYVDAIIYPLVLLAAWNGAYADLTYQISSSRGPIDSCFLVALSPYVRGPLTTQI
jgi:hypothetical protein